MKYKLSINSSRSKLSYVLFAFVIILSGCSQPNRDGSVADDTIDFEQVGMIGPMSLPISMNVKGDTLYVSVFHGDSLLTIYHEPTGEYVRSTILRGNGPGEMQAPIQPMFVDDKVYVFSRPLMTMFKSDIKHIDKMERIGTGPVVLSNIFAIGEDRFVGSMSAFGADEKTKLERYAMLDDSLNVMYTFGRYPSAGPNERADDADALSHFHQTNNVLKYNDSTLIAVGCRDISFYALGDDGKYTCRDIVIVCPYDYDVEGATEIISARTRLRDGYPRNISDAVLYDGKIILAIYAGTSPSSEDNIYFEIRDGETGELIRRLTPNCEVTTPFAINDKGEIIAVKNLEDGMAIMRSKPITD